MGHCSLILSTKQKGTSLPSLNEKASHHVTLQSHQLKYNHCMIDVRVRWKGINRSQFCD